MQERAIDRLKRLAGADNKIKKTVDIRGEEFSFWMTPMTVQQNKQAQKNAKSDDPLDFAMLLLVRKAMDEDGQPLFTTGDLPDLRNMVDKKEVDKLLLAMIGDDDDSEEELDMKSSESAAKKGS
nr:putative phage tail assembly chaperone [uncultured Mediterranean phage uvMED]